jgi:hypothetical protein
MKPSSQCAAGNSRVSQAPLGISVNNLSLGVLAGLCIGQAISAAQFSLAIALAALGFVLSIAASKLSRYLKAQSQRKEQYRMVSELERRLERLILEKHMKAHGRHSHRPHAIDESSATNHRELLSLWGRCAPPQTPSGGF